MAYKGGRNYVPKAEREIKKASKSRDIVEIAWILLTHCLDDIGQGKEPRYGKTTFSFLLQRLIEVELKHKKITKNSSAKLDVLTEWLKQDKIDEGGNEE
jgi:hypothetical protein